MSVIISKDSSFLTLLASLSGDGFNVSVFNIRHAELNTSKKSIRIKLVKDNIHLVIFICGDSMDIFSNLQFSEFDVSIVKINDDLSFEVIS